MDVETTAASLSDQKWAWVILDYDDSSWPWLSQLLKKLEARISKNGKHESYNKCTTKKERAHTSPSGGIDLWQERSLHGLFFSVRSRQFFGREWSKIATITPEKSVVSVYLHLPWQVPREFQCRQSLSPLAVTSSPGISVPAILQVTIKSRCKSSELAKTGSLEFVSTPTTPTLVLTNSLPPG